MQRNNRIVNNVIDLIMTEQREVTVTVVCGNCGCTTTFITKTSTISGFCAICHNCGANVVGSCDCDIKGNVRLYGIQTNGGLKK